MKFEFPKQEIEMELSKAAQFESNHELGKSRVCARKAAGIALQYWFKQHKQRYEPITPFTAIEIFYNSSHIPEELMEPTRHLLQKVDHNYHFPDHINLIAEANKIIFFVKIQSED